MDQTSSVSPTPSRRAILALSVLLGLLLIVSAVLVAALVAAYISRSQQLKAVASENETLRQENSALKNPSQETMLAGPTTYKGVDMAGNDAGFSFQLPAGYAVIRQGLPESGEMLLHIVTAGPDDQWDDTEILVNFVGDKVFDEKLNEPFVQKNTLRTVRGMRVVDYNDPNRELGGGHGVIIEVSPERILFVSRLFGTQYEPAYTMIVDTVK